MTTKKTPKNAKVFECKLCNFKCSKKCDFDRHLNTRKHKKTTDDNTKNADIVSTYKCSHCNKIYSDRNYIQTGQVIDNAFTFNRNMIESLDKLFETFSTTLNKFDNEHGFANSRARLRMTTLYQVAAANKGIVVGT